VVGVIIIHLDLGYRQGGKKRMETCQNTTTEEKAVTNMSLLMYMEYAYQHIGFIPKWLNIATY